MSRQTGATDEQIEAAAKRTYAKAYSHRRAPSWEQYGSRHTFIAMATDDAAALVKPDHRIVSVADLKMIISGLPTGELESGDYPELSAAANRVWKLVRDGE